MSWSTCEINPGVMGCQSGWRHKPGIYKACPKKLSLSFCVFRLGRGACTVSTRGHWLWALQGASFADIPIPPGILSQRECSGSRSLGLWSHCCRGAAKAAVLGFANVSGVRNGHSLIYTFTWQVQCLLSGLGSTCCGFFHPDRGTDTSTIWFWGFRCC